MANEAKVNHVWANVLYEPAEEVQVNGMSAIVDYAGVSIVNGVSAIVDYSNDVRVHGMLVLVDYEPASSSSGTDPAKRLRHGRTITEGVDSGHHTPG